jgi:hypothetical protein
MMVYRSIVVGLLGALVLLVAVPNVRDTRVIVATPVEVAATSSDAAVVDVSRRVAGHDPIPLLGLHPGERIAAIDGMAGDSVTLVGRWAQVFPGEYVDVEVTGGGGAGVRRVLILVHP